MFTLASDKLRIELPSSDEKPNISYRFERAGYIADVIFDGDHHMCASEPLNLSHPTSYGRGLCNEWVCDTSNEVTVGEYFPKFGVGLIRKEEDDKYRFFKRYKDVKLFPVTETHTDTTADFITEPIPCNGYAIRSTKHIVVEGNTITMTTVAENVGEKSLTIQEFCHNFMSIDGMAVGSDYHLFLPNIPDQGHDRMNNRSGQSGSFRAEGKGVSFCEHSAIATDIIFDPKTFDQKIPFTWKLSHQGAGLYAMAEDSYIPSKFCVWAVDHIVAPEVNTSFTIAPGESHEWSRHWTFGYTNE